jgi:trans-aconitate methyltransferase
MKKRNSEIRDLYNSSINTAYGNNYEFLRWFSSFRLVMDYFMMNKIVSHHIAKTSFSSYLELGPGPGTWTRLAFRVNPQASFDLVDISKEMFNQFKLEMRESENVNYHVEDFSDFNSDKAHDLFFSSRAIEYIEQPEVILKKAHSLLSAEGEGIILTKNPDYFRLAKLMGKKDKTRHQHQIHPDQMRSMLSEIGFKDVKVFPGIVRVPLLDRLTTKLSKRIFEKSYQTEVYNVSRLSECYVVTFKK